MTLFQNILLTLTTLCAGLIAGLLFGYSCSVNIGLKALSDLEYLKAMQSINQAIQNPAFFSCFMGAVILFPFAAWSCYAFQQVPFYLFAAASACYIFGVFGVTMIGNVPLNNQLAVFDISNAAPSALSDMRIAFEGPWNKYHLVRTFFSIASFALTIVAILKLSKGQVKL